MAATHNGVCALRCDRILWKSTVEPDPGSDYDESEALHPKARTRVGQFFANIKMRYRKGSHSSSTSSEVSTPSHSVPGSPISTPVGGKDLMPFSRFAAPEVVGSSPVNNINAAYVKQTPGFGLRSFSVDQAQSEGKKYQGPFRAGTTPAKLSPLSATSLPTEPVPTTTTLKDEQAVRSSPHRWHFLPFFRGDSSQPTVPACPSLNRGESMEMTASSTTYRPRKGDVVCLGYDSLDDKAMRRLEGRSDHRPVIGSFAIYL